MQAKKEHPHRHLAPKRQIALEVSWDKGAFGDEVPEVVGEWSDWDEATAIAAEGGARSRGIALLDLEEGIYAYKLRTSRSYALNASEPRTVTVDGITNNVLSVGGAREPMLHAPAAPFLHYPASGGVVVRAAVRKGADAFEAGPLWILWNEGHDARERETQLAPCGETDSHRYFQAHLPVSADRFEYAFRLGDGTRVSRDDGARFAARGRDVAEVPAWWRDAVMYTIFVDRFRPSVDRDGWDVDPGPGKWAGGDLEGLRRSLDDLADLGVNTLYLTPIHVAASCHRYDLEDPSRVDPALGGERALEALLYDVHARGMRLILDWSFSHASTNFGPYRDVLARGAASPYADWFQWTKPSPDVPKEARRVRHYAGCTAAPLLDLNQRELATYALATAEHWIRRGVDGLRIDCAAQVPFDLLVELRRRVRALNPDAVVIGELVPGHAWRWREAGALDASTDFGFYRLSVDRFGSPRGETVDLASRWEKLALARGPEPVHHAIRFISTHDFPRFFSLTRAAGCERNDPVALTWLLTMPGVPMLLYGEEIGMRADVVEMDPEGVWRDRAPFPWKEREHAASPVLPSRPANRAATTRETLRALLRMRAASTALRYGELDAIQTDGALWVYRRSDGADVVDVVLHQGEESMEVELGDDALPRASVIFQLGTVQIVEQRVTLSGPAAVVLRRSAVPTIQRGKPPHLRDDLFRTASPRAEFPRRLDVSLTERCNLKCAHCITFAPERTARGTARSMSPFVLTRLRGALRHAEHVGFVHGGETLTSPLLFDFLGELRAARGGETTMVHLLTNGMLLSRATTERLVAGGVRSISVSLDGAREATNDVVRSGAVFSTIRGHLEGAVDARRAHGWDLRLGLSTVVLPSNVEELDAIVDLAAEIGLDWVKFEELVPATPYARTSLLGIDDERIRSAVRAASLRAEQRGIVAVDHTLPMPRWVCAPSELTGERDRHRADEFANRAELNPCRDAWDLACIEPNGDVMIGAFHGVCAGNIAERDFLDVWNSEAARRERERSRLGRRCLGDEVVCLSRK